MKNLIFLMMIGLLIWTSEVNPKITFSVRVIVDLDGKLDKSLEGHMNQELRKLENIEINTTNPDWVIHVLIISDYARDQHIGYAVSSCVTRIIRLRPYLKTNLSHSMFNYLSEIERFENNLRVATAGPKGLPEILSSIVLSYDAGNFQPARDELR